MQLPLALSIPHCGGEVPSAMRATIALTDRQVAESVDHGTREIFGALDVKAIVVAKWSRLVVDLNRNPAQMDAKGVVALTDYDGRHVYRSGHEPTAADVAQRIEDYYRPYHTQLAQEIKRKDILGLIDCHSLNGTGPADAPDSGKRRKDIILSNNGNRHGRLEPSKGPISCRAEIFNRIAHAFESQGFTVSLNTPYSGGYITRHYGAILQTRGLFAIQIELNKNLFKSEDNIVPDSSRCQQTLTKVQHALSQCADLLG